MDQNVAAVLHNKECPYGHQCRALDCIECMELYEHEENNPSGPAGQLPFTRLSDRCCAAAYGRLVQRRGFGSAEDGKVDGLEAGATDKVNTVLNEGEKLEEYI